ncbi:unnamed protein product [Bursaphelenchus okinawaensis]|uniref:ZSWIM3 N-terminal domain-containing protein n=1 Tax=Bursaphelenchus okinawaensis TaxID=465554 RepID=A0A811JR64_9BILA|nr:unnamed protein product [Bursaphelenchus okinawaensis]CAG9078492.1 unnamed protein product [Bursaphelenchus okinawaensis]
MENSVITVCEHVDNAKLGVFQGARFRCFEEFRAKFVEWMAITHQRMAINSSRQMGVKYGIAAREQFKFRSLYFRCFRHGPGRRAEAKQPNREKNARDCGAYMRVIFDSTTNELVISTCHLKHRFHTPCREDTVKMVGRRSQWFEWVEELAPSIGQEVPVFSYSKEVYTSEDLFESLQHLHQIEPTQHLKPKKLTTITKRKGRSKKRQQSKTPPVSDTDLELFTSAIVMLKGQPVEKGQLTRESEMKLKKLLAELEGERNDEYIDVIG